MKYTNSGGQWQQWCLLRLYVRPLNILINIAIVFNTASIFSQSLFT